MTWHQVLQRATPSREPLGPDVRIRLGLSLRAVDADDAGHPGGPASLRRRDQRAADRRRPHLRLQFRTSRATSAGSTTSRSTSKPVITLWTNGTNNTFDVSGFSDAATINLTPGTFSSVGGLDEQHRHRLRHGDREGDRRRGQRHDHRIGRRLDPDGRRRQRQAVWRRGQRRADAAAKIRTRSIRAAASISLRDIAVEHERRHRLQLRPEHHHRHRADARSAAPTSASRSSAATRPSPSATRSVLLEGIFGGGDFMAVARGQRQQRAHDGDVRALPA